MLRGMAEMEEDCWRKVFVFGVTGFLIGPFSAVAMWYAKHSWSWNLFSANPSGGGSVGAAMTFHLGLPGITALGLFLGPLFGIILGFSASFLLHVMLKVGASLVGATQRHWPRTRQSQ